VLFTIHEYLETTIKESKSVDDFVYQLRSTLAGYKSFHRLSADEAEILMNLGKDEVMMNIVDEEISFLIFALELLRIWTEFYPKSERPSLNISDKRFKGAVGAFVIPMLKLKQSDPERYDRMKPIITDSKMTAKKFFMYAEEKLK
jgi:hypothetical protein